MLTLANDLIQNGWAYLAATAIAGILLGIIVLFLSLAVSFFINIVYGSYKALRGPNTPQTVHYHYYDNQEVTE